MQTVSITQRSAAAILRSAVVNCYTFYWREVGMSCHTKKALENMLEDVVNVLDLSDDMIEKHGPLGTPPAELVRLVLDRKDQEILLLKRGFIAV